MEVNHSFSAKPKPADSYPDYYAQVTTYVAILSGPAQRIDPTFTARTFPVTRAVSQQKREASLKVVELMLPLEVKKLQHPSAPPQEPAENRSAGKSLSTKGILVDLIGIEPMTSSMPSNQ